VEIALAADGILLPVLFFSSRRVQPEEIPKMGVFAAALFVISLIHFPVGLTSIHLCLFGLAGIIFGMRTIPVLFTVLLFQSLIFQHGGLISIGINTLFMSAGAILALLVWRTFPLPATVRSFCAGFLGIIFPATLISLLFLAIQYGRGVMAFILVYLPSAFIEGLLTLTVIMYIRNNQPEIINEN
jgi:cobalt/nickel transport system permease protein